MQLGREANGTGIARGSTDTCLTCHDSYNSPQFEARAYWDKIKHDDLRLRDSE